MNEKIKNNLIDIVIVWVTVGAVITIPASCCKALSKFYHQVVAKDEIVGQVNSNINK